MAGIMPFYYLANPRGVMMALREVKPTRLIGVPRFFGKGRQGFLPICRVLLVGC
ncbi:MAG: hypothetical protein KBG07_03810 [Elusimicrobia bacterium]|nr:hypothetical protein [Elusimicrobiota bacterium]